jgi:uncharacterized protein
MLRKLARVAAMLSIFVGAGAATAQTPQSRTTYAPINKERLNQNTVTVVTGTPSATFFAMGYDMVSILDSGDDMRILTVLGKGAGQNVKDTLFLRGVDMGITTAPIMALYKKSGELGPNLEDRLVYIAKICNVEFHVLIAANSGITDIKQLAGKAVNFEDAGSGSQFMGRSVFDLLGIAVKEVNMSSPEALIKLKSGEIAATVMGAGKPTSFHQKLPADAGVRLLAVPYLQPLETDYIPTKLTSEDYPGLIPKGATIDTVATSAVLAAYNWPRGSDRYRRLARFTEQFFNKFPEFKKAPRHPKWKEASISATVPGWKRFSAAQDWIDTRANVVAAVPGGARNVPSAAEWISANSTAAGAAAANPDDAKKFERFVAEQKSASGTAAVAPKDAGEERVLFQKFLEWSKRQ